MRRIAITGISGYLGSQLLKRLAAHPDVERIVGVDARPPTVQSPKLAFFQRDITRPIADLFSGEQLDAAVHLAFVLKPTHSTVAARRVNVEGTRNLLEACRLGHVGHLLYLGSTAAYGAHRDNPVPLTEESPLRPNRGFQYSREKAETDRMFLDYGTAHPEAAVTILRGCVVIGPGGARSIGAKMFTRVMVRVAGHDPQVQYLHEDDLVDLLVAALEKRPRGIYNVAGDGLLRYSDVARLAGRRMAAIPGPVLSGLMGAAWALHLQSESSAAGLDFIAYPWVASNEKLKAATGFRYRYSSEDAIKAYVKTLK